MTSLGRAPLELTKPFDAEEQRADQEQEVEQEDTALEMEVPSHPFDWKDFLLFVIPIAITVLAIWRDASQ